MTHPIGPASCMPLAAPLADFWRLVHGPLEHWARVRPTAMALRNEAVSLSFAELHARVRERAQSLAAERRPAMLLLDARQGTLERIAEFLAIIESGRCAAVADPDWPEAVRTQILSWLPEAPCDLREAAPTGAFYTGFTSGSTGLPKGFMRHHLSWTESFRASLLDFGPVAGGRTLAPGRISHSLFLFGVMQGLWCGTGAVVQEQFSAARCLQLLAAGDLPCLVAVPSQLLLMLQLAERRKLAPIPSVELITISGARWMRSQTPRLRALFPKARIVEFYGASEASYIAWMDADENAPPQAVGRPFSNVQLQIRKSAPGPGDGTEDGLIYVRSPMLFMDYVGTTAARTGVLRDGEWLSVRDMGRIDADGLLHLAGRESRMIVTQGKNLFPEEIENLLLAHPAVAQASVHGVPDPLRGAQVHAVLGLRQESGEQPTAAALARWLRERIEGFKVPRHWWLAPEWPMTASGKTDHASLGRAVLGSLRQPGHGFADPALTPLNP